MNNKRPQYKEVGASCWACDREQHKQNTERKKILTMAEIEVILGEVELWKKYFIFFFYCSSGVTGTGKSEAWKGVTDAMNKVSLVERTIEEVNQKLFNAKLDAKKKQKKKHLISTDTTHKPQGGVTAVSLASWNCTGRLISQSSVKVVLRVVPPSDEDLQGVPYSG